MTTLIIPDIHQKIKKTRKIIKEFPTEKVILLGDYFDSHDLDSKKDVEETIDFLNEYHDNPSFILLIGNHDVQYLYKHPNFRCSGYSKDKENLIKSRLNRGVINNLELFTVEQNFIISHAGFHPLIFSHPTKGMDLQYINMILDGAIVCAEIGCFHPSMLAGRSRGGNQPVGGVTWQDWEEFIPIKNFKQIVGHSRRNEPQIRKNSINLDTGLNHIMLLNNGSYEIIKV